MKFYLLFFICLLTFLFSGVSSAKPVHVWKESTRKNFSKRPYSKNLPQKKLLDLDSAALQTVLSTAPKRFSKLKSEMIITLPNSKGGFENFRVYDSPVMHEMLAAKYPRIKTYYAHGVENPRTKAYLSSTPLGFKAMIISADQPTFYVEPYSVDMITYTAYQSEDQPMVGNFTETEPEATQTTQNLNESRTDSAGANEGQLRVYRLAVATTGEYASAYGGNKEMAMAGVANSILRISAIMENDFGIKIELPANNDLVVYTDSVTDPFGSSAANWSSELQGNLNTVIGRDNFDFGHLLAFSSSGGGNGQGGGAPCLTNNASAYSVAGPSTYDDDRFIINVFAHEVAHQLGASHSHSTTLNGVTGAPEVALGSTIMGYGGTGYSPTYVTRSDPYFHAYSIDQVVEKNRYLDCGTTILTGNTIPVANAGSDYVIPKSTPFILQGTATDEDTTDSLTYNWEQMDGGDSTVSYPTSTQTYGPIFRSQKPVAVLHRYFPRMDTILEGKFATVAGTNLNTEVLPSVARSLNFRFTVRDNSILGGSSDSDDMHITVSGAAGPFKITSHNTIMGHQVGSTQLVQWSVAGTDANGINCSAVDILLSTDNGKTFPTILLSNVPNNGSASIVIPNLPGDKNRLMVRARNNIFFDVNDASFSIYVNSDSIAPTAPTNLVAQNPGSTVATLSWTASSDNLGVTAYDIYHDGVYETSVTGTSATVNSLNRTVDNVFYVKARDAAGNTSAPSNSATVQGQFTFDAFAPTAATLVVSKLTSNMAQLAWSGATDNQKITAYEVYRNGTLFRTIDGETTTLNVLGLLPATTYSFYVITSDSFKKSPASNTVTLTTPATSNDSSAPIAATLTASGVTASQVNLAWSGASDNIGIVGYELYQNGKFRTSFTGTSLTLGGLNGLSTYSFYVFAKDSAGNKTASNTVSVTTLADVTPPEAPVIQLKNVTASSIQFAIAGTFDNVRVTGFDVYRNGVLVTTVSTSVAASGLASVNGLAELTTYNIHVIAKDAAGNRSPSSNVITATTTLADRIAPTTPTNFTVTGLSSVGISWDPSTDDSGTVTYYVMASEYSGTFYSMGVTSATSTTRNLNPATSYIMYVFARDPAINNSKPSNYVTITPPGSDFTAPASPSLSALGTTSTTTLLSWSSFGDNVGIVRYEVFQNDILIRTINESVLALKHPLIGLSPSTSYRFNVFAIDAAGNRANSNVVTVNTLASSSDSTVPVAPTLSVTSSAATFDPAIVNVTLAWSGASDNVGVVAYDIYQNGTLKTSAAGTATGITFNDLAPATNYNFYLVAKDANNNKSAPSNTFNITSAALTDSVLPSVPTGLSASATSSYSTTLTWNPSTDNSGVVSYEVYQNGVPLKALVQAQKITFMSLSQNTTYSYYVVAKDKAGNKSGPSTTIQVTTPASGDVTLPTAPTLTFNNVNPTYVQLQWTGATDNVGIYEYEIYQNGFLRAAAGITGAQIQNLTAGTTYSFYVIAKDRTGNKSPASNTVTFTTTLTGTDVTKPSAPVLSVTGTTASSISLSWTAATDDVGVVGYEVNQNGSLKATVTTTSYVLTGLSPSTTYSVNVLAKDSAFNRQSSNTLFITTPAGTGDTISPTASVLSASGTTYSSTNLSWTAGSDNVGVVGYEVYQNGSLKTTTTGTSLSVTGLASLTSYSFYVRAKDAAGNRSVASNSVSVTTLAAADTSAPTAPVLSASGTTYSSTTLSWSAASDNIAVVGYDVYQNGSLKTSTTSRSLSVTGLASLTNYSFYVMAKDAAGNRSVASNAVNVTTLAPADTSAPSAPVIAASGITTSSVILAWAASADNVGVVGYDVYQNGTFKTSTTGLSLSVTGLAAGTSYSFYVMAKDAAGNRSVASNSVSVTTLTSGVSVALTAPATVARRTTIVFSATAASNAGVNRVEFYVGTGLVCTDSSAPYTCSWKSPGSKKTLQIKATAIDNGGSSASDVKTLIVQ